MSTAETTEKSSSSAQAVVSVGLVQIPISLLKCLSFQDEEYEKLERFRVNGRRIVFFDDSNPPEGGFGIVRQAELHHSAYLPAWLGSRRHGAPQLVAVKQIKISKISNVPRVKRAFTREVLVWSGLDAHPGIAKFVGFYADFKRSEAWLLSPWEPNGNVSEFIKLHSLEVPEKLSLVYDTIDALNFLHQLTPPVCHGDIKSANVLVTADYKARLCDFGLARLHEDSGFGRLETSTGSKGSIRWCSPELIDGAPRAPTSDVYAWAWLVWEIMTGDVPYEGTSTEYAIIRKIFESPLPEVDGQSRLSDCLHVWDLLTRCWNVDPVKRPTSRMCQTTMTYRPRCRPAPANAERSAELLENLSHLETWKGNQEKSSAYLNEALRLYQEEADIKGIARVLLLKAECISDYVNVRSLATTALEHYRALNDNFGIAEASYHLGSSMTMLDQCDEALPILRESLELRRTHGFDIGVIKCLGRIADIQRSKGEMREALSTLGEALEMSSQSGDRLRLVGLLDLLGTTHMELSDYDKAADALSEAIVIARSIGMEGPLSNALRTMGELKMRLEDHRKAEELFQESISIARHTGNRFGLARGLYELGQYFRRQSKLTEAVQVFEESCLLLHELSQQGISRGIAGILVRLKIEQGDLEGALRWRDHIIAFCRSQKHHWEVAKQLGWKGEILVRLQRYDEAALHWEAAIATCRENGKTFPEAWSQLCAIPKAVMQWERRSPLSCDLKKLQRRQPQLVTASLKLPIPVGRGES